MNVTNTSPAGTRVDIIVLTFTVISAMVVFLRIFTRLVISKRAGFEDACIGLAMVSQPCLPTRLFAHKIPDLLHRTYRTDRRTSHEWAGRAELDTADRPT